MLAFDLETTGVEPGEHLVTCAAVCDPEAGIERIFFFARLEGQVLVSALDQAEEFMRMLDEADSLCAFNGAGFDLPFIQRLLGAAPDRVLRWRMKLHDVYEACKLALDVTFPLRALLELNGLPGKTGSGADAIRLAQDGEWPRLGEYCLNDTRVTHQVSALDRIRLPNTRNLVMDRRGNFHAVELAAAPA
jgi:hypothetical protein